MYLEGSECAGTYIKYFGEGADNISCFELATITNMEEEFHIQKTYVSPQIEKQIAERYTFIVEADEGYKIL